MADEKRRVPLGDRVRCSLRNWLTQFALRRGCSRSDVLNDLLCTTAAVDMGGGDPLHILQLAIALEARGVDAERVLNAALEEGGRGRRRR